MVIRGAGSGNGDWSFLKVFFDRNEDPDWMQKALAKRGWHRLSNWIDSVIKEAEWESNCEILKVLYDECVFEFGEKNGLCQEYRNSMIHEKCPSAEVSHPPGIWGSICKFCDDVVKEETRKENCLAYKMTYDECGLMSRSRSGVARCQRHYLELMSKLKCSENKCTDCPESATKTTFSQESEPTETVSSSCQESSPTITVSGSSISIKKFFDDIYKELYKKHESTVGKDLSDQEEMHQNKSPDMKIGA